VNNNWLVQLQEISTVLIIIKKHDMLMLVTSIQTAMFEMSTGSTGYARLEPFAERQNCCIIIGL